MDQQRFDRLSRSMAARTTRRQAVRQAGAGGLLGGIGAVFGAKGLAAQGSVQTCALPIYAEVYLGPYLGTVYEGTLSLDIDEDGAIDSGFFETIDGMRSPLVGHAAGRGIDLRVDLGNEQILTLTGTAELDFAICQGAAAGSFGGPEMGNMGTWTTVMGDGSGSGSTIVPPAGSTETPVVCDPTIVCMSPSQFDPATCTCFCPEEHVACGDLCCPAGADCVDPSSSACECPAGTELCGEACISTCGSDEYLDEIGCNCEPYCPGTDCTPAQTLNLETCDCEDLPLCLGGQVACGVDCVDLDSDPQHCGSCDHVCPEMPNSDGVNVPSLCVAGDCCLDLDQQCAGDSDCCSGSCDFIAGGLRVCT